MKKLCDLHTHSCYSDGTLTPARLIREAERAGLAAVALTDHNTVAGLPEFLEAAKAASVEAVPGVEFSADYRGRELHILGLFIGPEHYGAVNSLLEEALRNKEQSNIDLVEKLNEQGMELDYWAIREETPGGNVNRAVIGAQMVRLGYAETVKEAFDRWLSPERGFFVPPRRPDAFRVIRFIKSIGAVAVLAHPFLNLEEGALREFLARAEGLDGMEVFCSEFDADQQMLAGEIAEEFGLVKSGGSDFHGANKPGLRIGAGRGNLEVPLEQLEKLKRRKNTGRTAG